MKAAPFKAITLSILLLAVVGACYDPVHKDDVASLGDEAPGVPEGPLHRPGQHCTTCHGGDGPGSPEWSIAGTIFAMKGQPAPEIGATVTVTDRLGAQYFLTTNAAGNFYVDRDVWDPAFPVSVAVRAADGSLAPAMNTTIGRDGGCGACHRGVGDNHYMPAIYVRSP